MPKSEQEFERIRAESKEKILNKAIEVFAKNGYAATNINDIAQAAGISAGLMYRYFRSKQELFETIAHTAVGGLVEMTAALSLNGDPKEIIEAICGDLLSEMDNEEFININMMMIQGIVSESNPLCREILRHDEKMFEAAAKLIQRGQRSGVFGSGDPMAKSALLFSSVQGITMMKFLFKDKYTIPSLSEITAFLYANQ